MHAIFSGMVSRKMLKKHSTSSVLLALGSSGCLSPLMLSRLRHSRPSMFVTTAKFCKICQIRLLMSYIPVYFKQTEIICLLAPGHQVLQDEVEELMVELAPLQFLEATCITRPPPIPYCFSVPRFIFIPLFVHECSRVGVEKALRIHNRLFSCPCQHRVCEVR